MAVLVNGSLILMAKEELVLEGLIPPPPPPLPPPLPLPLLCPHIPLPLRPLRLPVVVMLECGTPKTDSSGGVT